MGMIEKMNEALERKYFLKEAKEDRERFINFAGRDLADRFDKLKAGGRIKNDGENRYSDYYYWINRKSVDDLEDYLCSLELTPSQNEERKIAKQGAEKLYDEDGWKVYLIHTYDAAKYYGRNTKWCIAGNYAGFEHRGKEFYRKYLREGVGGYHFIIPDDDPYGKWCYLDYGPHFTDNTSKNIFFNSKDTGFTRSDMWMVKGAIPVKVLRSLWDIGEVEEDPPYVEEDNVSLMYDMDGWKIYKTTQNGVAHSFTAFIDALARGIGDETYTEYYAVEQDSAPFLLYCCGGIKQPNDAMMLGTDRNTEGHFTIFPDKGTPGWIPHDIQALIDNLPTELLRTLPGFENYAPYSKEENVRLIYSSGDWEIYKTTLSGLMHEFNGKMSFSAHYKVPYSDEYTYYVVCCREDIICCATDMNNGSPCLMTYVGSTAGGGSQNYTVDAVDSVSKLVPERVLKVIPGWDLPDYTDEDNMTLVDEALGWKIYKATLRAVNKHFPNYIRYNPEYVNAKKPPKGYYILTNGAKWLCYLDRGTSKLPLCSTCFFTPTQTQSSMTWSGRDNNIDAVCRYTPIRVLALLPHMRPVLKSRLDQQTEADRLADTYLQNNNTLYYTRDTDPEMVKQLSHNIREAIVSNTICYSLDHAFVGIEALEVIKFERPSRVTTLGDHFAYLCNSLVGVDIPGSVTTILRGAIQFCGNLLLLDFLDEESNTPLKLEDGWAQYCSSLESLVLPARTQFIGSIPSSVKTLSIKGDYRPDIFYARADIDSSLHIEWIDAHKRHTYEEMRQGIVH